MAKMYTNQKTKLSVISGKITSIGDDRQSFSVATQQYNKDAKKYDDITLDFKSQLPIEENAKVGCLVTVAGFEQVDMMSETSQWIAGYVSTGNDSFQYKTLAVVNGDVMFARYMDEVGEDGKPNMTKERMGADGAMIAPKPKSPHFDIGVATKESDGTGGEKRVLHIIKAYPDPVKDELGNIVDGKKNFDKIEALKKRFANFDKESNPMRVTIATQPGTVSSSTKEYNGKNYENNYNNHMGVYSLDIEYLRERVNEQQNTQNQPAQQSNQEQETAQQAHTVSEPVQETPPIDTVEQAVDTVEDVDSLFSIS